MSWTAIVSGVLAVVAFIRELLAFRQSADDRQAGADAANNAARERNDARVRDANEAEIEADKAHKTMPGDEAFDNEFRRD